MVIHGLKAKFYQVDVRTVSGHWLRVEFVVCWCEGTNFLYGKSFSKKGLANTLNMFIGYI